jgi:hypothetical protein
LAKISIYLWRSLHIFGDICICLKIFVSIQRYSDILVKISIYLWTYLNMSEDIHISLQTSTYLSMYSYICKDIPSCPYRFWWTFQCFSAIQFKFFLIKKCVTSLNIHHKLVRVKFKFIYTFLTSKSLSKKLKFPCQVFGCPIWYKKFNNYLCCLT